MIQRTYLFIFISIFQFTNFANGQYFHDKYVSELTILENDSLIFIGDSLFVENLVMEDYSKLKFANDCFVLIHSASIGIDAHIDASGANGDPGQHGTSDFNVHGKSGLDGQPGRDLYLVIKSFSQLESLKVKSNGGHGGNGGNGFTPAKNPIKGDRGFDGGDAGSGGAGSSAGNITFLYDTGKVKPVFGRQGKLSINFITEAGKCGKPGIPGRGGKGGDVRHIIDAHTGSVIASIGPGDRGANGSLNSECIGGQDGELIIKKLIQPKSGS